MAIRAWRPVDRIDTNQYLYHYTTMEKAYNILCSNELWFSDLTSTNDVFEQKVKISFKNIKKLHSEKNECIEYKATIAKINEVRKYMDRSRASIKLLCFSRDVKFSDLNDQAAYTTLQESLTNDLRAINVIGRGFSLPRMWAQYASDNKGVCFILNKNKILRKVKRLGHSFMSGNVEYYPLYSPYRMPVDEFNKTYELITTQYDDAIKTMLKDDYQYLRYDLFSKLSDWSSENEYRIILTNNTGEKTVKLKNIREAIEGIVFGANTDDANTTIINLLGEKFELDIRKIVYDDIITRIV